MVGANVAGNVGREDSTGGCDDAAEFAEGCKEIDTATGAVDSTNFIRKREGCNVEIG